MEDKKGPSRALRIRLIFAIPVTLLLFTLSSGFLTFSITRKAFQVSSPETASYFSIVIGILTMGGIAFLSGLLLAYGVTNPLKKMIEKGARVLYPSGEKFPDSLDELSGLTNMVDKMAFSLNRFIQDHQIIENLPEGLLVLDHSGMIISSNRAAEGMFSFDVRGQTFDKILLFHPQNRPFLDRVDRALRGEGGFEPREEKIKNLQAKELTLWVSFSAIRERKELLLSFKNLSELVLIRDQIRQAESLAVVGSFASNVSHEVRNPLGSMRGLLEILQADLPPEDRRRTYVDRTLQEIDKLTNLTENLLDLLHVERMTLKPGVDVNEVLRQSLSLARQGFLTKVLRIDEKYGENLPPIGANPEMLGQAFLNLILNAFQETPEGGYFSLSTTLLPSAISIQFHNSGSYIPPEEKERIFTAFFTTKPHGTGLGLFLTRRIVALHQGKIEVESNLEKGTTFRIELPLMSS